MSVCCKSKKLWRRNVLFCLKGMSLQIGVTSGTIFSSIAPPEIWATRWRVWRALCTASPQPSPSDVNNIVFVTFDFESDHFVTDLVLFLSAHAGFFCFLLGDEESCPFAFNKQTAVWINKLKGSGCGPVRTVCSVSVSVCLSSKWEREAPCPNCIGLKPAHNGLLHTNRLVSLVQRQHYFSPLTWSYMMLRNISLVICWCTCILLCHLAFAWVTACHLQKLGERVDTLCHWWLSQAFKSLVRWLNSFGVMKLGGGCLQHACLFSQICTSLAGVSHNEMSIVIAPLLSGSDLPSLRC